MPIPVTVSLSPPSPACFRPVMVSTMQDSRSRCFNTGDSTRFPRNCYYYTPPPSSPNVTRSFGGRSMRTIRSTVFQPERGRSIPENVAEPVSDGDLVPSEAKIGGVEEVSRPLTGCSACSCDISGELQRISALPDPGLSQSLDSGILHREISSSTEIIETISPEDLYPTVKLCIDGLNSSSIPAKRSAAAKLRVLAKNRADNRALIGETGAVPALLPLLRCPDPVTQEHAVTALLNLSLLETNKRLIFTPGAVKSLIHVLKTGTSTSKQNAACVLLSLASTDKNKLSIGASGAIPPLIALLKSGSSRGKHDALTTLYKLCSTKLNKERAVGAGAAGAVVELLSKTKESGLSEKAAVVMSSLAGTEKGREAIVEANGMAVLVEAIENGSDKVKGFAVVTVEQLCGVDNYRELFVDEGGIPPLLLLSQSPTLPPRTRQKAESLLQHVTQSRPIQESSSSSSPP